MATTTKMTKRQAKLNRIATSIATFAVSQTYTDESEAQALLAKAIGLLNEAAALLKEE